MSADELTIQEWSVLSYLRKVPSATTEEIARALGWPLGGAKKANVADRVQPLVDRGLIEMTVMDKDKVAPTHQIGRDSAGIRQQHARRSVQER